jgi:hypothetical protein
MEVPAATTAADNSGQQRSAVFDPPLGHAGWASGSGLVHGKSHPGLFHRMRGWSGTVPSYRFRPSHSHSFLPAAGRMTGHSVTFLHGCGPRRPGDRPVIPLHCPLALGPAKLASLALAPRSVSVSLSPSDIETCRNKRCTCLIWSDMHYIWHASHQMYCCCIAIT